MVASRVYPKCPHCDQSFEPGSDWWGANYCRGLYLYQALLKSDRPKSTWDLSQETEVPYKDAARAMMRLREYNLVIWTTEARRAGGERFLYRAVVDAKALVRFQTKMGKKEGQEGLDKPLTEG